MEQIIGGILQNFDNLYTQVVLAMTVTNYVIVSGIIDILYAEDAF